MTWIKESGNGVVLAIHAAPGAARNAVQGLHGETLKLRLQAPPVDGKANAALLAFLADAFGIPKGRITLLTGQTHRRKRVAIEGVTADDAERILLPGGGACKI